MNSDYAVYVSNLSKVYRFYQKPAHRLWEALLRRPMHKAFSALEDISFSVNFGSTLGIIGENGAGKSTLLKILAKTLTPSTGSLEINGRVAALLELGTGFHHEFTGRQNIYLNASLLGLSDKDIKDKEQEIVEFSELGEFIDRPIRTYSSGMVVRLAFSIATSVDPDILIVDEALSVGDQRFQQKCVERMAGFRKKGKTIIVCSHSMYLINEMCAGTVWLDNGKIKQQGPTPEVVSSYLAFLEDRDIEEKPGPVPSSNSQELFIKSIEILDKNGAILSQVKQFSPVKIKVEIKCVKDCFPGHLAVVLENQQEEAIFSSLTKSCGIEPVIFSGLRSIELNIPCFAIQKGVVRARCIVSDDQALRIIDERTSSFLSVQSEHPEYGLMWMEHSWKI